MSKTIKEAADSLGITKTAIRKYFTEEFRKEHISTAPDGRLMISDAGIEEITAKLTYRAQTKQETTANQPQTNGNSREEAEKTNDNQGANHQKQGANQEETTTNQGENQALMMLIETLQKDLAEKNTQISRLQDQLDEKEKQVTNLTAAIDKANASLNAAQALNAADKKLLLESNTKKSWWPFGKKKKAQQEPIDYKETNENE